mmetsp:Transcript_100482/g.261926  ORF Transcript_100482/g.261926 Transcript_100482/m.261926 type:complete len:707 (-) Transcript_100482:169-2289(-)
MAPSPVDVRNLPNLPGFNVQAFKDNHHKGSNFKLVNGQMMEGKMVAGKNRFKEGMDRLVLRFYGYFKEAVVETNLENYRIRRIHLLYYLEDDSCHIIEPRQDNAGIPQGQLVRRHKFPAPDGGFVRWQDIQVGGTFHVYGKAFMITDCDAFTRDWCLQNGVEQEEGVDEEVDHFTATREAMKSRKTTQERSHEKLYREVMLGGGHVNADMQQFLENDRNVLRFFAFMDDLQTTTYERRPFVILVFLADDTIELREQYPYNCGRDNFPIYFRRGKIPRGKYQVLSPQDQTRTKADYLNGTDFAVGMEVTLLGNVHLSIYDADDFTRSYFKAEYGVELAPAIDVRMPERAVPKAPEPPYTGYGSWEDSMGSVTHLVPKPPRKDLVKLFENEGKVLRFKAKFANPKVEDVDRVFVVSFYRMDDQLSIHEPPQRNSGIVTGKFLEKGTHANGLTGKLFSQQDLYPGAVIQVYNQKFEILGTDEYTAKFVQNSDQPRAYDMDAVLEKVREAMRQKFPLIRDVFRKFDLDHNGVITQSEFQEAFKALNIHLSKQDLLAIMRHFDTRQDGQVSYNEFCDAVCERDYTQSMLEPRKGLEKGDDAAYEGRASGKEEERQETERVRKAVRDIGDIVYKHTQVKTRLMKEFGKMTHRPTVSVQQIQGALGSLGFDVDLDDVIRAVLYTQPDADLAEVSYVDFLKALDTTFHENSNPR